MSASSGPLGKPKVNVGEQRLPFQRTLIPGPKGACGPGTRSVTSRWISGGVATLCHKTQYKTKKVHMRGKSEVQTEPRVPRLTRWPSSLGRLWPRVGLRGPRIAVRLPAPPCDSEKTRPGRAFPLRRTFPQGCAILIFPKRLRGRRGGEAAISPGPWPAAAARGGHIRLALDGGVRLSFTTDHERVALPIPHSGCSRGIYEVRSGCGPNAETPSSRTARTPRGLSSPHPPGDGRLSPSQGSSVRLRTVSSCWAR